MKKLFLIATIFGSMFFTSCNPDDSTLDEFQNPQACCGEDGTILPPPPPPPTGSGNNGG
ncbi:hypothetical protein GCM10011344_13330 [Dokdonia pacifica]|uniref:Lipoprotein n=1 Tax=Dokdonia pacifica TaxID=1627892 RepID=A0A238W9N1_9FLAO|nr:hypothetical protein [Dokdonia pacifica]GGG14020.1 hypothetical protein GCM10011344_13330 [Dokdonia pacifica]SNR42994.1 hypothetical protein SAMN06265376_101817 [Dokdonia pacifica]